MHYLPFRDCLNKASTCLPVPNGHTGWRDMATMLLPILSCMLGTSRLPVVGRHPHAHTHTHTRACAHSYTHTHTEQVKETVKQDRETARGWKKQPWSIFLASGIFNCRFETELTRSRKTAPILNTIKQTYTIIQYRNSPTQDAHPHTCWWLGKFSMASRVKPTICCRQAGWILGPSSPFVRLYRHAVAAIWTPNWRGWLFMPGKTSWNIHHTVSEYVLPSSFLIHHILQWIIMNYYFFTVWQPRV